MKPIHPAACGDADRQRNQFLGLLAKRGRPSFIAQGRAIFSTTTMASSTGILLLTMFAANLMGYIINAVFSHDPNKISDRR